MTIGIEGIGILTHSPWFWILIGILALWELVWKGFALWYSARNKHKIWFVLILILNTLGILPIIYLLTHKRK